MTMRVRFAPSPTGYLHIGGARTALYNYLLARKHGGTFILRIEDTDLERSTPESVQAILDGMTWLNLDWDEGPGKGGAYGPYFQTQRFDLYKEYLGRLIERGKAYRCYTTKEELDAYRAEFQAKGQEGVRFYSPWRDKTEADWPQGQSYVWRFRAPRGGQTVVRDVIKGDVVFENDMHVDDFVVARQDGTPTYNFTVVVDDVTMKITHVIRGDDHLNNTAKQILLYEALGEALPVFGHLPMILGSDKKRLSKRHGATSVMQYREMGFKPHAVVNYLARLGWSHGDDELFTMPELTEKFTLEAVGKSSGVFDQEKMLWVNHQYIQHDDKRETATLYVTYLKELEGLDVPVDDRLLGIVEQLAPRARTMVEMVQIGRYFFKDDFSYDEKADKKFLKADALPLLERLTADLTALSAWTMEGIQGVFEAILAENEEMKLLKLAQPVRVAINGTSVSPGIYETLCLIDKPTVLARLQSGDGTHPAKTSRLRRGVSPRVGKSACRSLLFWPNVRRCRLGALPLKAFGSGMDRLGNAGA